MTDNNLQISQTAARTGQQAERLFQPFLREMRIRSVTSTNGWLHTVYIGDGMSWIKLAVAGIALCAGASVASAQGGSPAGASPQGGPQGGQRGGRGIAKLLEGITLTDAQQVKVDAVKEKYAAERQKLMPNGMGGGPPDESVRTKMREMSDKQNAELRAILTVDQQKVFDANLEKRKQNTGRPPQGRN